MWNCFFLSFSLLFGLCVYLFSASLDVGGSVFSSHGQQVAFTWFSGTCALCFSASIALVWYTLTGVVVAIMVFTVPILTTWYQDTCFHSTWIPAVLASATLTGCCITSMQLLLAPAGSHVTVTVGIVLFGIFGLLFFTQFLF